MDATQLVEQAQAAARSGDRIAARDFLARAVTLDPGSARAWFLLSQVVDDIDTAIDCLERAGTIEPYNEQINRRLQRFRSAAAAPESPAQLEGEDEFIDYFEQVDARSGNNLIAIFAFAILIVGLFYSYRRGWLPLEEWLDIEPKEQLSYQVYPPSNYTSQRRWPVFVGINGFNQSAVDCQQLWQVYGEEQGFLLVCPHFADENGGWDQESAERALIGILRRVRTDYSVERQVFLAGYSTGGRFSQGFVFNHPNEVFALATISALNYFPPNRQAAHIPILILVGEKEGTPGISEADNFSADLDALGYTYHFQILPGDDSQFLSQSLDLTIEFYNLIYQPSE